MKNIVKITLLLIILMITFNSKRIDSIQDVEAKSAILMEMSTNRVLFEKDAHNRYLTASIAKIMTAIVAIEFGKLDEYYTVDEATTWQIGSSIYLKKGERIKLLDLIYGLMLRSGNDAAHMIALNVGGSIEGFAKMMNDMAKKINMVNSTFENPSGLDEDSKNYSTAYDMGLLMSYAMKNKLFKKINETKKYYTSTLEGTKLYFTNTHRMVGSDKDVTGGKPGYTEKAFRTLVTTAKRDNMELVVVTFVCGNDWRVHRRLFDYGFDNFFLYTLLKKQVVSFNANIYKYSGIIKEDVSYPVKEDEISKLSCIAYFYKKPISSEVIGHATIYLNNEKIYQVEIYRYK